MRIGREMRKAVQNSLLWERLRAERIVEAEAASVRQSPARDRAHNGVAAGGRRIRTTGPSRVEYLCFDWFCRLEGWKKPVQKSPPLRGGPAVRICLPPPASLSHQCLPCLPAQRPGFCRECEPGRDQRMGRAGPKPARLGRFSLTGIAAVPPREIKAQATRRAQALAWAPSVAGRFSSPGGCADRSNRAADRVR